MQRAAFSSLACRAHGATLKLGRCSSLFIQPPACSRPSHSGLNQFTAATRRVRLPATKGLLVGPGEVVHDVSGERFILKLGGGHEHAVLKYRMIDSETIDMYSTYVPTSWEGQGIAKLLADQAFQLALDSALKIRPTCWYLAEYLRRHPRPDLKYEPAAQ